LLFVYGRFDDLDISKEQKWLWYYFTEPLQRQFVTYYLTFNNKRQFTDHTGYSANKRWIKALKAKLLKLIEIHSMAKSTFDFETLGQIERGEIKFRRKKPI
jgi:hypothetical protein